MDPANFIPYAINVARQSQAAIRSMAVSLRDQSVLGSRNARRLRSVGWIPATVVNPPQRLIAVSHFDVVKQYQTPSWTTRVMELKNENDETIDHAIMRKIYWHATKETPLSVDFVRYNPTPERAIKVDIPIEIDGIYRCEDLTLGYYVNLMHKTIPVYTYLNPIPPSIVINVADFKRNKNVKISDLWHSGGFPAGMWPATNGSNCNESRALEYMWEDSVILKISKI